MNYDDYKCQRKVIRNQSETSKEYHKGNIVQSINLCSKCGKVLSKLRISDLKIVAVENYTRYGSGFMHYSLCKDAKSCYKQYCKRKG